MKTQARVSQKRQRIIARYEFVAAGAKRPREDEKTYQHTQLSRLLPFANTIPICHNQHATPSLFLAHSSCLGPCTNPIFNFERRTEAGRERPVRPPSGAAPKMRLGRHHKRVRLLNLNKSWTSLLVPSGKLSVSEVSP